MPPCRYEHPSLQEIPLETALAALADPCRVKIVRTLLQAGRELACHEFELCQSKATVSHHFRILREGGVIETRSVGTRCLSRVREPEFSARFPGLLELVTRELGEE